MRSFSACRAPVDAVANEWIERAEDCRVCCITQSGFLRLATNPAFFADEALTIVTLDGALGSTPGLAVEVLAG